MRRILLVLLGVTLFSLASSAQQKLQGYAVGFYNLENLFDYTHDEGKKDYDFLPDGSYHWNEMKYTHKLHNMARVLSEMGTDKIPDGCAFIGVSEVENDHVLRDLVGQPALASRNFKFCHIEGPDRRGIDCALLYNPKYFKVNDVRLVPYVPDLPKDSTFKTRGFLTVSGELAGEPVTVVVCHWPSRFNGSFYRETAGREVRAVKDSLLRADHGRKVFVMGDMNDDPTNSSMYEKLGAKENIDEVKADEMFNPWYNTLVKGHTGTLKYNGNWNLFDQIVMTPNLLNQKGRKDFSTLKYISHQIFRRDYLFQDSGKYKGNTKRTTAGGVWLDGYSDHLPVVVYLAKAVAGK